MSSLALYTPVFPQYSETFIYNKLLYQVKNKSDILIICDYSPVKNWETYNKTHNRILKGKVYKGFIDPTHKLSYLLTLFALPLLIFKRPLLCLKALKLLNHLSALEKVKRLSHDFWFLWHKPTTIHFEFGNHYLNRLYLKNLWYPKIICSFRGYDLNYLGLDQADYYTPVWNKADYFHFLGKDLHQRAKTRGFPDNKPYVLISPAIDTHLFKPLDTTNPCTFDDKNPIKLLTVSRLDWKKGYEWALFSMHLLAKQKINFQYSIVGDGPMYEALMYTIHQLDLSNQVKLLGKKAPHDIPTLMNAHHLFIQPSISEGFCNSVIEAQAMQMPVLATDADGLPENIEDGVTGFIIPRRDSEALAEKISWFYHNPLTLTEFGKRGRDRVIKHFTLEKQTEKFCNWYKEIGVL